MNISVIIPTRNRPLSCGRLLKALLPQVWNCDGSKVEVIIVDDGSTSASLSKLNAQIPEGYSDRVRVVSREFSGGPSAARNSGIAQSRGDLLVFLDDDCIPARGFLSETVRLHNDYPDILLINGNLQASSNDSISRFWFYYYNHAFNFGSGEIYRIHRVSSGNFSIKRSLLESFSPLFDEELASREDYDLFLRLNQAGIPVFKANSINATIECRKTLLQLLKQRAWYEKGEIMLRKKYGAAFLRQAQSGNHPRPSLAFIHIYIMLYGNRKLRAFRHK